MDAYLFTSIPFALVRPKISRFGHGTSSTAVSLCPDSVLQEYSVGFCAEAVHTLSQQDQLVKHGKQSGGMCVKRRSMFRERPKSTRDYVREEGYCKAQVEE